MKTLPDGTPLPSGISLLPFRATRSPERIYWIFRVKVPAGSKTVYVNNSCNKELHELSQAHLREAYAEAMGHKNRLDTVEPPFTRKGKNILVNGHKYVIPRYVSWSYSGGSHYVSLKVGKIRATLAVKPSYPQDVENKLAELCAKIPEELR